MKMPPRSPRLTKKLLLIQLGLVAVTLIVALTGLWCKRYPTPSDIPQVQTFPEISAPLNPTQQHLLNLLKTEWQTQPAGTKYSQGVKEPWCADFVSWSLREIDQPLANPHSGSWRIPGVYTLEEYFKSQHRWRAFGQYQPQFGDVALYRPDSKFGHHTNFVLDYRDGQLTTLGGNEFGAIRIQTHRLDEELGLIGFGLLKAE